MDVWRLIAERKIEEAMAEGAFDDLSGSGMPVPLDEDPFQDPSLRMAHRLLRNNGFAPAWIEEGRQIDLEAAALRGPDAGPKNRRARILELNRRIFLYNLKTPSALWHKLPLPEDPEI